MAIRVHHTPTFTATVYVGFREAYSDAVHGIEACERVCQEYCDEVGLCVSITPTRFAYTGGEEPGAAVGLINYPRFPKDPASVREHAFELARRLLEGLRQLRVTVVMPDETVMLSAGE